MKIVLIIPSLQPGGAERVLSIMANHWIASEHEVTVLTFASPSEPPFYRLDTSIEYRPLNQLKESSNPLFALRNNARRISALRKSLKAVRPDVVISFLTETNVVTLLATRWLKTTVFVAEHNDPYRCPVPFPWAALRTLTYPRADRIVVLTRNAKSFFSPRLQAKTKVIPNPVMSSDAGECDEEPERENVVLAIGRLNAQKGFDLLLHAYSAVAPELPLWRLVVIGEGPDRRELEQLADELRIRERVDFRGVVKEPRPFFQQAGIFVLSSRYEGFPMGLCEAMAHGCPVIATEYSTGVFDLIQPGANGMVVPREDIKALSGALRTLISDNTLRNKLGAAAPDITKKFGIEQVMSVWDNLITECTAIPAPGRGKAHSQFHH